MQNEHTEHTEKLLFYTNMRVGINLSYFNTNRYVETIDHIKKNYSYMQKENYKIRLNSDNSVQVGLCNYYLASVSPKFLCPFDLRPLLSIANSEPIEDYYLDSIEEELDLTKISLPDDYRKSARCQHFCSLLSRRNKDLYEIRQKNNMIIFDDITINHEIIANKKAIKIAVDTIRDFRIRI